jgi:hypothetical protein
MLYTKFDHLFTYFFNRICIFLAGDLQEKASEKVDEARVKGIVLATEQMGGAKINTVLKKKRFLISDFIWLATLNMMFDKEV